MVFHARDKPPKLKLKPKGSKKNHPEERDKQTTEREPTNQPWLRTERPRS